MSKSFPPLSIGQAPRGHTLRGRVLGTSGNLFLSAVPKRSRSKRGRTQKRANERKRA